MQKTELTTKKRPYARPQLVDHGDAVKATKGVVGVCWEIFGNSQCEPRPGTEEDE
jgi:hypothetical protein